MKNKVETINRIIEWLIYMVGYALILVFISFIFKKTVYIDPSFYGIWGLLAAIIIYGLNKTIKPLLVWLTLPITALTLGIFYPFINVIILKITSLILGNHFNINGIVMSFVVAILISFMNLMLDEIIIKPLLRGDK